jgi:RNA polymerase sigma factor (sigma-70 family)
MGGAHIRHRSASPTRSEPLEPASLSTLPAPRTSSPSAEPAKAEAAWDAFVAGETPLLLKVARSVTHDEDAAMDAYTFVLGKLREDGFARLAAYRPTAGCTFATWLAVVARRLCFDHHRAKYGRPRSGTPEAHEAHQERRRLADLVATAIDDDLPAAAGDAVSLDREEVLAALQRILDRLAPRDKLLLRYRFEDDLSALQIARLMRFPTLFHVYRRINALLGASRRELQKLGFRASDV